MCTVWFFPLKTWSKHYFRDLVQGREVIGEAIVLSLLPVKTCATWGTEGLYQSADRHWREFMLLRLCWLLHFMCDNWELMSNSQVSGITNVGRTLLPHKIENINQSVSIFSLYLFRKRHKQGKGNSWLLLWDELKSVTLLNNSTSNPAWGELEWSEL